MGDMAMIEKWWDGIRWGGVGWDEEVEGKGLEAGGWADGIHCLHPKWYCTCMTQLPPSQPTSPHLTSLKKLIISLTVSSG